MKSLLQVSGRYGLVALGLLSAGLASALTIGTGIDPIDDALNDVVEAILPRPTLSDVIGSQQVSEQSIQTQVNGAVWIVDQQHPLANDASDGTEESPLLTIQEAARRAVAGDTVLVKSGVYTELSNELPNSQVAALKVVNSGTSTAPIIFAPFPGHQVTIDQGFGGAGFYI